MNIKTKSVSDTANTQNLLVLQGKAAAQATPIATAVTATGAEISPEVMLDDAECYLVCGCFDDAADAAVKVRAKKIIAYQGRKTEPEWTGSS